MSHLEGYSGRQLSLHEHLMQITDPEVRILNEQITGWKKTDARRKFVCRNCSIRYGIYSLFAFVLRTRKCPIRYVNYHSTYSNSVSTYTFSNFSHITMRQHFKIWLQTRVFNSFPVPLFVEWTTEAYVFSNGRIL